MSGGANQPVDTHQEVHTLAHPDGSLVSASSPLAVSAAQSGTWLVVPDRPSQRSGGTAVHRAQAALTATTDLYTVTAGKTFYMTSLAVYVFNTSTTQIGDLRIVDRAGSDTLHLPVLMTAAGVGSITAASAAIGTSFTFQEPKPFSTKVTAVVQTGTLTFSLSFGGYES